VTERAPNDEAGAAALVARLGPLAPALVVLEATGGLERLAAAALAAAGLPVAVVNPRQVRAFAQAVGQLAKTDALDAAVLARFAEAVRPPPRPLPDAAQQELAALLARRRQVVTMLTAERQRLGAAAPTGRAWVRAHVRWLEGELAALDGDLGQTLRTCPVWRAKKDLLRSVPGVGPESGPQPAGASGPAASASRAPRRARTAAPAGVGPKKSRARARPASARASPGAWSRTSP
jgi:transposase